MLQIVLVLIIVALALVYVGRRVYRALTDVKPRCACGEDECPLVETGVTTSIISTCNPRDGRCPLNEAETPVRSDSRIPGSIK